MAVLHSLIVSVIHELSVLPIILSKMFEVDSVDFQLNIPFHVLFENEKNV